MFPRYDGWSFANIAPTVLSLFGIDAGRRLAEDVAAPLRERRFEHVLLLLLDAIGFETWCERAQRHPFFERLSARGRVTSLTAVFPSTTSASLTTLGTGLTPREHGLLEWNLYLEEVGDVVVTLPFKRWNGKRNDELEERGFDGSILFSGGTVFEDLARAGVPAVCFVHESYAASAYSRASRRGSRSVSFATGPDLADKLAAEIRGASRPTFFYAYWDRFDVQGHEHSPRSRVAELELELASKVFGDRLPDRLGRDAARRTLLLVTADHGQIEVRPERTIYLTDHAEVLRALERKPDGSAVLPTGGMRDVFLHVRPEALAETKGFLEETLRGKAEVWLTREAAAMGLYGPGPAAPCFERRAGDLLVLPYETESVWAQYPGAPRPHRMRGHHGGLTPREMFIPFAEAMAEDLFA
ncbi:MAG: alkaline phosphatase family protein [Planctomycetes bacterium]|nr:alkaline phosphatase family protein [Planctomycetota bacterium]